MEACQCNYTLANTGLPNCEPLMQKAFKVIYMETFASDGSKNRIALTDTLDATFFEGKINESDPTKRWYPTCEMKNVTDERGDNIVESFEDQSEVIVEEGPRMFQAWLVQRSTQYQKQLN